MSTFRDAIQSKIEQTCHLGISAAADAVLAMPEMQAIRRLVRAVGAAPQSAILASSIHNAVVDLPESVVAWVLDGES